ncbi:MAG: MFS transporter [Candidatus Ranarchaeia archaeon]
MVSSDDYRWVMLLIGFLLMATFAFALQELPPILSFLIADLGITYTQAGSLMSVFQGPGLALSLFWGIYSAKIGIRKTAVIAFMLLITGNFIVFFAGHFNVMMVGRLISGIGALALPILGGSIVSHWFKGKELGLALGIYNVSMPLGTLVCLNSYGVLGLVYGWRVPVLITSIFACAVVLLFFSAYRTEPVKFETPKITLSSLRYVLIAILSPVLAWMFFQATSGSFNTFATSYFLSVGNPIQTATLYASTWMIGSLLLSPFVGGIIDRYQNPVAIIVSGSVSVAFALFLLPRFPEYALALMMLLAFGAALVPTAVLTTIPKQLRAEKINIGFSLLRTFASIGFIFGPLTAGILRDLSGDYILSFTLMAGFMLACTFLIMPLTKRT